MEINLDSSVIEHLTSNAGVTDSIPGSATFLSFSVLLCVHTFNPFYVYILVLLHSLIKDSLINESRQSEVVCL